MAITKTIQATVKNRTDTAANWTQKNPVLAEGEIIVVQTSAGETRLKIGDGVKTFTQLPYTDEQIYNNVVTSVNGQTGDVTLPDDFIVNATLTEDETNCTLDKTFAQIQEAVQAGKKVFVQLNHIFTFYMPLTLYSSIMLVFTTTVFLSESVEQYVLAVTNDNVQFLKKSAVTYNSDPTTGEKTMPQVYMSEDPVSNMQIATKKYVDNSLWYGADMEMSDTSTHPVRNMVIKKYVDDHVAGSQSLGLTSAAVGQIPKIKAVDSNGVPTEWEAATFSGSSSDYVINVTLDTLQSSIGNWVLGYSCTCDKTYAEVLAAYQSGAKVLAHVIRNKEITLSDGSKRTIPIINEAPLTRYIAAQNLLVFDYVHNATDLSVSSGGLTYTTGDSGDSMICYVATYQFAFGAADTSADSVQIPTTTKVQDMIDTSVGDISTNTYTIQVSNTAPAAGTSNKIITYVVEETVAESKNSLLGQ